MTWGTGLLAIALGVSILFGVASCWQLRPSTQRYQSHYGGVVEWKKLQKDQFRTTLVAIAALVLQVGGLLLS